MTEERLDRVLRRLDRERKARLEAESIAERVTGELYSMVNELKRLNTELEDANRAIKEFVAIASHDIRAPLTSIIGFTEMMRSRWEALSETQKMEFLVVIDDQGQRIQRLTDDLLTVSRLEAGIVETHIQQIGIAMQLERTVHELGAGGPEISVEAEDDLVVLADADHVQRILVNYLSNAVNHGAPPIAVEAHAEGTFVEVRVRDHGTGVPHEFVHRLFGKFARADTELTRGKRGTGLGLSIVRGLAHANGGDAWYEPNLPCGSCFGVRLPKVSDE